MGSNPVVVMAKMGRHLAMASRVAITSLPVALQATGRTPNKADTGVDQEVAVVAAAAVTTTKEEATGVDQEAVVSEVRGCCHINF